MNELLSQMLLPDGKTHSLSIAISARSGSGKTTLISRLVQDASQLEEFENTRFIYVSVKMESLFGNVEPINDLNKLGKWISKNRVGVYYPPDPENYEASVDALIEMVFDMANRNEEANFCLIIDDCNILDGFDNRGNPSSSMKKAIIAGRSLGIKMIPVTHRLANLPRLFNGNLSGLILMNMNNMDSEYANRIFGMDFENLIMELDDYKWAYVDLISESVHRFNPIKV